MGLHTSWCSQKQGISWNLFSCRLGYEVFSEGWVLWHQSSGKDHSSRGGRHTGKKVPRPQVFPTIVASIRKGVFASMLFTLPDWGGGTRDTSYIFALHWGFLHKSPFNGYRGNSKVILHHTPASIPTLTFLLTHRISHKIYQCEFIVNAQCVKRLLEYKVQLSALLCLETHSSSLYYPHVCAQLGALTGLVYIYRRIWILP